MNNKLLSIEQLQDLLEIRREMEDLQRRYDLIIGSPESEVSVSPGVSSGKKPAPQDRPAKAPVPAGKPASHGLQLRSFAVAPEPKKRRSMSPEARERIAEAQRRRWASRQGAGQQPQPAPEASQ